MMPLVMSDGREPVPTTSGFATTHPGRCGDVAATGARGRAACGCRVFRDEGAAPRVSYCARIMSRYLEAEAAPTSAHGDPQKVLRRGQGMGKGWWEGRMPAMNMHLHALSGAREQARTRAPLLLQWS